MCRRNSESCSNYDMNKSQTSLHQLGGMRNRQLSLTQSDPDEDGLFLFKLLTKQNLKTIFFLVPVTKSVSVPKKKSRNLLLQIHAEYTSITDELESNVCHMMPSPTQSIRGQGDRPNLTKRECAELIEKQHLRECEENDYVMLEHLFQARCSVDESKDSFENISTDIVHRRLRRETAVELPVSPSKSQLLNTADECLNEKNEKERARAYSLHITTENKINQNLPQTLNPIRGDYLNPCVPDQQNRLFKKSCESLQKNSSTDTEYSVQPYKFIKQSSNETNTSLTSSFNVDNSSFTNDLSTSIDADHSLNTTVIEIVTDLPRKITEFRQTSLDIPRTGPYLRKQFSVDQTQKIDEMQTYVKPDCIENSKQEKVSFDKNKISLQPTDNNSIKSNLLKESSSSTESKDERNIPSISTNLIQDDIAKLSSNIKSSTDDEKDPPFNETMC